MSRSRVTNQDTLESGNRNEEHITVALEGAVLLHKGIRDASERTLFVEEAQIKRSWAFD
jgi:hypothetical protein